MKKAKKYTAKVLGERVDYYSCSRKNSLINRLDAILSFHRFTGQDALRSALPISYIVKDVKLKK
ncbi:MAG: hypothetical protein LBP26_06280 [Clostridiales bacterium]|jgi:hypothetical protein|nr:hypothetical protein [Clostridiales bacterium]